MADYSALNSEWRRNLLKQLRERNKQERGTHEELIVFTNKLFVSVDRLKTENVQLTVQKERLQQENLELQMRTDPGSRPNEKILAVEKKLFQLQEEVTELHRRKGEHAQQLIDLKNTLEEKEKELTAKTLKLQETEMNLTSLKVHFRQQEQKLQDMEAANQLLKDEHAALQLAFSSLEHKTIKCETDYNELLTRWLKYKRYDADCLNAENERLIRMKQAQVQKELEEAAREPVNIVPPEREKVSCTRRILEWNTYNTRNNPVCIEASLPNKAVLKFDAHDGEVNAVRWSPSGKLLATGGGDRKVKLWDVSHGQIVPKGTLTGSNAAVTSLDFDSEESIILATSNDFASRVWLVSEQRLRHTLTGHSGKVLAAKFLESNRVVSGSHDRTLKIWDLRSRACVRTIFAGSTCNDLVTSDSQGTSIISGHFDKRIRFWDIRSESSANEILLQGKITSLDLSPDSSYLLSCVRDDTLKLLDLRMNQVVRTFSADGFKVGCDWTKAKFSPDGQYIVVGSQDGTLFIWNTVSGEVERMKKEHSTSVTACSWNPSGSYIASGDRNKKVIVWSDL